MPKTHPKSQQTSNRGVARLATYCANHDPQLIFRETSTNDIGIDGEIELIDCDGHATGEIIKFQLKSTESHRSYIQNETKSEFIFDASKDDMEYWGKVTNDVLLVIFDNRDGADILYARSVKGIDITHAGRDKIPVRFDKTLDCLSDEDHSFIDRFSKTTARKVKTKKRYIPPNETLISNLIHIDIPSTIFTAPILERRSSKKSPPKQNPKPAAGAFSESEYTEKIHKKLDGKNVFLSDWIVYRSNVLTFHDLQDQNSLLKSIVDIKRAEKYSTSDFFRDEENCPYAVRLINRCLKEMLKKKGFWWNSHEKLYYATPPEDVNGRSRIDITWSDSRKTSKRNIFNVRKVLEDGKCICRHFAFEASPVMIDNEWYLAVLPTWIETIDGFRKSPHSDKSVSTLKRLEKNASVKNHVRFICSVLLGKKEQKTFFDDNTSYPFLTCGELVTCAINKGIDEKDWLSCDPTMVNQDEEELDANSLF